MNSRQLGKWVIYSAFVFGSALAGVEGARAGGDIGHGGDPLELDFKASAQQAAEFIILPEVRSLLPKGFDPLGFETAVEKTSVRVKHRKSGNLLGLHIGGIPKTAVNHPKAKVPFIELDDIRWMAISSADEKLGIALHEFIAILGFDEDYNYEVSSKILNLLKLSRKIQVGQLVLTSDLKIGSVEAIESRLRASIRLLGGDEVVSRAFNELLPRSKECVGSICGGMAVQDSALPSRFEAEGQGRVEYLFETGKAAIRYYGRYRWMPLTLRSVSQLNPLSGAVIVASRCHKSADVSHDPNRVRVGVTETDVLKEGACQSALACALDQARQDCVSLGLSSCAYSSSAFEGAYSDPINSNVDVCLMEASVIGQAQQQMR